MRITAALLVLAGCVQTDAVQCADGTLCRFGSVCASVTNAQGAVLPLCVKPDQLCTNLGDYCDDAKTTRCYDGVCLAAGCGNDLLDPGELCDDGNTAPGDHCSADCLSKEVCRDGHVDPVNGEACDDGNAVGHDGCSGACAVETPHWIDLDEQIGGLYIASLTYDAARDKVVLFGGYYQQSSGDQSNAVWEWDDHRWTRAPSAISPPGRYYGWMAYDAGRGRTVAYGGLGPDGEVWEWDGARWTVIDPPAPPGVDYGAALAYDSVNHRMVLAGGSVAATWDGQAWTPLPSPGAIGDPVMGFDPERGVVVLLGTASDGTRTRVLELSGTTWVDRTPATTPATCITNLATRFVWDPAAHQLVLASSGTDGFFAWTGTAWVNIPGSLPPWGAYTETLVVGTAHGMVGFLDGATYTKAPGGSWKLVATAAPSARVWSATAVDRLGRRAFVVGGYDLSSQKHDVWQWNGAWTPLVDLPGPRSEASAAFDEATGQLVVFGGFDAGTQTALAATLVFDGASWKPIAAGPEPSARIGAQMTYDATRHQVVLYGGYLNPTGGPLTVYDDTWIFDGVHWHQVANASGPGVRRYGGLVFDPIRERVILWGGNDGGSGFPTDTWEWDGATWTAIATADHPPGRYAPLAWDPSLERAVLVSGDPAYDDVWAYDGRVPSWTRLAIPTPLPGRDRMSLFSSPLGDGVIAFAGSNGSGPQPQFALLRWDGGASETCASDAVDADGDGLKGCADPDCWATCTPEVPPGAPVPAAPRTDVRCGDGVCDPRRETCITCPSDCTCAASCGDFVCEAGETATSCPGDCSPP